MNNKGVTMVTVVVMIIIMVLIATVSIVAGNKLIVNSNEYKQEQELESVRMAVTRKKAEMGMAGSLIPVGDSYVGIKDPILKTVDSATIAATDWYLLDEENLEKLGLYDVKNRYIVNYDYEVVLSTQNPRYIEEYMLIECIHDYIANDSTAGQQLSNKSSSGDSNKMVINKETGELFGTGWYLLKKDANDYLSKYSEHIESDYLVKFSTAEYVRVTPDFEEI